MLKFRKPGRYTGTSRDATTYKSVDGKERVKYEKRIFKGIRTYR